MKIQLSAKQLLNLGAIARSSGTMDKWAEIIFDWLKQYIEYESSDKKRHMNQAAEYCLEVYKNHTRADVHEMDGSIIRCWKVGKRLNKESDNES